MRFGQWKNFFKMHLPFVGTMSASGKVEVKLPYQILVLCRTDDVAHVEYLIRQQLLNVTTGTMVQSQNNALVGKGNLTNIAIEILCTISERAKVVQLVTRLGLEKSVRSVRWESIPSRLTA